MSGGVCVSGMADVEYFMRLTTKSTALTTCKSCDFRSNCSVRPVHDIFAPALQILTVTRDLAIVLTKSCWCIWQG